MRIAFHLIVEEMEIMIRLFKQHYIRKSVELDGIWDFHIEGETKSYQLPVPSCWEQHPKLMTYRGKGIYTKKITLDKATALRIEFKGISHTGDIYFDEEHVGHHYNAYTPFSVVIKEATKGEHRLKIVVDNSFGPHSSLHMPNDYYTYGGLIRPVALEEISPIYIQSMRFTPMFKDGIWSGQFEVTLRNLTSESTTVHCEGLLAHQNIQFQKVEIEGDSVITVTHHQEFKDVTPWSHEQPQLYELKMIVYQNEQPIDDLVERVGFRIIELEGTKIKVNGQSIFLKGFNRHEDFAHYGCAIPFQLMVHDMDLMQDMGVNAIRTSHYPNDERFLDLCDERGIYVWEENHARGLNIEAMENPNFDQQCEDCIDEMVTNHSNHPSIIIWGILNECASESPIGRIKYQRQFEQIKSLDQSRPRTSATCRHFSDITLDLQDIVSYNIYSGWYEDVPVEERNNQEIDWIQEAGGEGKPIIVSEFGAGGIYGYRDRTRCKWSEERQADILEQCLEVYMKHEQISGVFIWQFADCRITEEGGWFASRPRSHNNKGVVDEFRRPKMAYDVVKAKFSE